MKNKNDVEITFKEVNDENRCVVEFADEAALNLFLTNVGQPTQIEDDKQGKYKNKAFPEVIQSRWRKQNRYLSFPVDTFRTGEPCIVFPNQTYCENFVDYMSLDRDLKSISSLKPNSIQCSSCYDAKLLVFAKGTQKIKSKTKTAFVKEIDQNKLKKNLDNFVHIFNSKFLYAYSSSNMICHYSISNNEIDVYIPSHKGIRAASGHLMTLFGKNELELDQKYAGDDASVHIKITSLEELDYFFELCEKHQRHPCYLTRLKAGKIDEIKAEMKSKSKNKEDISLAVSLLVESLAMDPSLSESEKLNLLTTLLSNFVGIEIQSPRFSNTMFGENENSEFVKCLKCYNEVNKLFSKYCTEPLNSSLDLKKCPPVFQLDMNATTLETESDRKAFIIFSRLFLGFKLSTTREQENDFLSASAILYRSSDAVKRHVDTFLEEVGARPNKNSTLVQLLCMDRHGLKFPNEINEKVFGRRKFFEKITSPDISIEDIENESLKTMLTTILDRKDLKPPKPQMSAQT